MGFHLQQRPSCTLTVTGGDVMYQHMSVFTPLLTGTQVLEFGEIALRT